MIRIELTDLEDAIETEKPKWLARARETREYHRGVGKYERAAPSWSEIKRVYMRLQHGKCAYCERQLTPDPNDLVAAYDLDVEHVRPKSSVRAWPPLALAQARGLTYDIELGTAEKTGYYLLAHEPMNYVAACKPCNSGLKSDFFPVAGKRCLDEEDPAKWSTEAPYLLHPLGAIDKDPKAMIAFAGAVPVPVETDDEYHDHWRARVTIDFFDLARERLVLERCERIAQLYLALTTVEQAPAGSQAHAAATRLIPQLVAPTAPHSSCSASFRRLFAADRPRADVIGEQALKIYTRDAG